MLVQPYHHGHARPCTHRIASRPANHPTAPTTLDQVSLSHQIASTPPASVLAAGAAESAARVASDLSTSAIAGMVEELQSQGVEFQHRPRFLFWLEGFEDSQPGQVAKLLSKGKRDRVQVRAGEAAFAPVNSLQDLREVQAFYGSGQTSGIESPELAKVLAGLKEAGVEFCVDDNVGPYGAYNRMQQGGVATFRMPNSKKKHQLVNLKDATMLAFLLGRADADSTGDGELAASIKLLQDKGLFLGHRSLRNRSEDGFELYRKVSGLPAGESFTVGLSGSQTLGELSRAQLDEPRALEQTLDSWKQLYTEVGGDQKAYDWVTEDGSERSKPERARLALGVREARLDKVHYEAILKQAGKDGDLDAGLRLCQSCAEVPDWEESFGFAGSLEKSERSQFFQALDLGEGFEPAKAFWDHFSQKPERLSRALDTAGKVKKALKVEGKWALDAVATAGEDLDVELLGKLTDGGARENLKLYGLAEASTPKAREFLLQLSGKYLTETVSAMWPTVSAAGEDRIEERVQAFGTLFDATKASDLDEVLPLYQDLCQAYPPEAVPQMAEYYAKVVKSSGGDLARAEKNWEQLGQLEHPELAIEMFSEKGGIEKALEMLSVAERDPGNLAGVTLQERVEALKTLDHIDGPLVETYDFLIAQHDPGESLAARTDLYSTTLAHSRDEVVARTVVGIYEHSPYHQSPEAAQHLGLLMRVGHDIPRVRRIWEKLESQARPGDLEMIEKIAEVKFKDAEPLSLIEALQDFPLPQGSSALDFEVLKGQKLERVESFLKEVICVKGSAEEREAQTRAFFQIAKEAGWDDTIEVWPQSRLRLDPAEVEQQAALLARLKDGEFFNQVNAARREGESLEDLGRLASWAGTRKFEAWRDFLENASPEGGELVENTAFAAEIIRSKAPEELLREVFAPVARESTATRRRAILALCEAVGQNALSVYRAFCKEGPPGSDAFDQRLGAYQKLVPTLGKRALEFMEMVGELQDQGSNFTLEVAAEAVLPTLVERPNASWDELKAVLREIRYTGIEIDAEQVTVGDFAVPRSE